MVEFCKHTLGNGLRVIVNRDTSTPMAVVNVLYDVGARDEDPDKTGLAHLFEHLMFEGSLHIADFDRALQRAGGENNAFTSNDLTNYYMSLPAVNLETAFWLESDRMMALSMTQEKLDTQKNVVLEEFRQVYLNQPYGDANMLLRQLCYNAHPYQWSTIGKCTGHIESFVLDDLQRFYARFYRPCNAILSVSSAYEEERIFELAEKWFADIPAGSKHLRSLRAEPDQLEERRLVVARDVPAHQLTMSFHCSARNHHDFFATDMLSDVLANGESARLQQRLMKEQKLFSEVNAYISGSLDPGMFVVTGKLHADVALSLAEEAVWDELQALADNPVSALELQKVKNKIEAAHIFSESNLTSRTMNLAFYELMGDAGLYNRQIPASFNVHQTDLQNVASKLFRKNRASILYYSANHH